jgi:predicted phage tail protein
MNEPLKKDLDLTTKDITEKVRTERDVIAFRRDKIVESATSTALLPESEAEALHTRWDAVQSTFVDEPRKAVEEADKLVANAIERLAQGFSDERSKLEKQWSQGDEVSTEDLRIALQRYRAFFSRLLSI